MSTQTKTTTPARTEGEYRNLPAHRDGGRLGLLHVLITCILLLPLSAPASEATGDLTPLIPEEAEKALQFGETKDLAVLIAIDADGNHKIYRGKQAETEGKEVPFPIDAKGISSMDNFTIFKTNPWYIYVNGYLVCL